jgi:hypothetical protein
MWSSITGSGRVIFPLATNGKAIIDVVRRGLETGELRAVVDRTHPLDEIVEAHRFVETEQKVGIVVIEIAESSAGSSRADPAATG